MEGAFLDAAYKGDLPKLKELLAKGCSANAKTEVNEVHTLICLYLATVKHVCG